jgi:hypothetical protein
MEYSLPVPIFREWPISVLIEVRIVMKSKHNRLLNLFFACWVSMPALAVQTLVDAPNARIQSVDSNWSNEGRFAVFIVGNEGISGQCSGWVHFQRSFLINGDAEVHKMNYSTALLALQGKQRIKILGASSDCWTGVNIVIFGS